MTDDTSPDINDYINGRKELFRELSANEKEDFKKWARENWKIGEKVNSIWHPVIVNECATMLDEDIRENTHKLEFLGYAFGWSFTYENMTVDLDSSTDEISEEEQLEMAIEHFWEAKWEELFNGES
jgi:hypothetical protein